MAHGLFGYFNFILKDGELTGNYFNNLSDGIHHENGNTANGQLNNGYNETYTTRYRDNGEPKTATLIIDPVNQFQEFILNWTEVETNILYEGKGMLREGTLHGYYHRLP